MGFRYYLNLFKTGESEEKFRAQHIINTALSLVSIALIIACLRLRSEHVILSAALGIAAVVFLIFARILTKKQNELADTLMQSEILDESDEVDAAFIAYRLGYKKYLAASKKQSKKLLPLEILWTALALCYFPMPIILTLAGKTELADKIYNYASFAMMGYLVLLIVVTVIISKSVVWYQDYSAQLAIINNYKERVFGRQTKYKITEDKKPYKQFEYLFPNKDLCGRFKRLQNTVQWCGFFVGIFIGFGLFSLPLIVSNMGLVSKAIIISVFVVATAALLVFFITALVRQKVTTRKQKDILKSEISNTVYNTSENYAQNKTSANDSVLNNTIKNNCAQRDDNNQKKLAKLCLSLHEMRHRFLRQWNLTFLFGIFGVVFLAVALGSITSWLLKTDKYGVIFFLMIPAGLIAIFMIWFKAFARLRQRMIRIEDEIDRLSIAPYQSFNDDCKDTVDENYELNSSPFNEYDKNDYTSTPFCENDKK